MELRTYQQTAINTLFEYMANYKGNPCIEAPCGAGKSVIIAGICRELFTQYGKDIRVVILAHQKELIEQDARALYNLWDGVDIGIYSASLKQKNLDCPITYASIQSIYRLQSPRFNFIIVDECHLINAEEENSMYRKFINRCACRVIGLTATPWRLGLGDIVESGSLFDYMIHTTTIEALQNEGYLARLVNKGTVSVFDLKNVTIKGGEYVESSLQKAVDTYTKNEEVVDEIIKAGLKYKREHWLIFCAGIEHAEHIAEILNQKGIIASPITSEMSAERREEILYLFSHGQIKALTNARLLTTGYDYPDIDMVVMLQPTLSPVLYSQEAGRGLRKKTNGGDCLLLDFAGNVLRHGPITHVQPPRKKGEGTGPSPMKCCPKCLDIVHTSVRVCPTCGYEFPKKPKEWELFQGDVNGDGEEAYKVYRWYWEIAKSKSSGLRMIVCNYTINQEGSKVAKEYFCCLEHDPNSRAYQIALRKMKMYLWHYGEKTEGYTSEDEMIETIAWHDPPLYVVLRNVTDKNGKLRKNVSRVIFQEDYDRIVEEVKKQEEAEYGLRNAVYSSN